MAKADTERILVVDDDEPIRSLAERVLRRANFEVDVAKDGAEAVEKIERNHYAVILLDLMMPRMSGFDVINHLKESSPELLPKIIIMTAATNAQLKRLSGVSVHAILRKPFDIEELRTAACRCADETRG